MELDIDLEALPKEPKKPPKLPSQKTVFLNKPSLSKLVRKRQHLLSIKKGAAHK